VLGDQTAAQLERAKLLVETDLPGIFCQTTEATYLEKLQQLGPLPCLFYEHFTKAQMVDRIRANSGIPFKIFIFPRWQRLMAGAVALPTTARRLETLFPEADLLIRDAVFPAEATALADFVRRLGREAPGRMTSQELVDYIVGWRKLGGPAWLRGVAAELARRSFAGSGDQQGWISGTFRELDRRVAIALQERALVERWANCAEVETGRAASIAFALLVEGYSAAGCEVGVLADKAASELLGSFVEKGAHPLGGFLGTALRRAEEFSPRRRELYFAPWLSTAGTLEVIARPE
jgi:hypothetical protein